MKQFLLVLLSIFIILLTISCSSVTSKYPLSANPEPIDQKNFEGVWQVDNDEVVQIKFANNGIAMIAGLEWQSDQFIIMRGEMIVSEGNEHNFLSIRFKEKGKWMDGYLFLPYKFTEQGDLILWPPVVDAFEEAIREKILQGTIEMGEYSTSIMLTSSPEKLFNFINNSDNFNLFDYRDPIILLKVTR
jgi:hypothetical protein